MYLGKLKATGQFKTQDILEGELYVGQWEILWYLALVRFSTLDLISTATGYSKNSLRDVYLRTLSTQFKLVERIKLKLPLGTTERTSSFYTLTNLGYKKLGIGHPKRREYELAKLISSEHTALVVTLLSYFFRHDTTRYKGEREQIVKTSRDWMDILEYARKEKADEAIRKYGVGFVSSNAIKQFNSTVKGVPIPDVYFEFDPVAFPGLEELTYYGIQPGNLLFIEVETGEHRKPQIEEKLERYNKSKWFFEQYLNKNDYAVLFVMKSNQKKETLDKWLMDSGIAKSTSFPILQTTIDEMREKLTPAKHFTRPTERKQKKEEYPW
jgi:hypothetical protein